MGHFTFYNLKMGQRYRVPWGTSLPTITGWVRGTEWHAVLHFLQPQERSEAQRCMVHFTSYNYKKGQRNRGAWGTSLPTHM